MAVPISTRRASLLVANEELATVREAMRELNRMLEALERGELDKVVLTQRNQIRAVLISLERYVELEQLAGERTAVADRLSA
jgi:PHD/YefM family antitoxin component YafN of YafNO toxin-antitoxin module